MLALATIVVVGLFEFAGNNGFSLWDESFLWYGAQRVMHGEVPICDFMAYDPGRYYWSAALMNLWSDDGIMALRRAAAIFQAMGLFVALLLIYLSTKSKSIIYLLLSAVTLVVWMFPLFKLYDISLSIFLIGALAFLAENPTGRRYFLVGVAVGLIAVFGRNHGVYGVAGSIGVMVWLNIRRANGPKLTKGFALWTIGIVVGYTPILFTALLVPGFATAFWASIEVIFKMRATNIPLPIPWPWRVPFATLPLGEAIRGVLEGLFFIALLVFGVLSIVWLIRQKLLDKEVPPALVAASFLTLPYAHYAYSRSDVTHLALGVFPLLVSCLVFLSLQPARLKWPLASMLCAASLLLMSVYHPGWQCCISKQCVNIEVSGNNLLVDPETASEVSFLRKLEERYAPSGRNFVATPWPGAYALLGRKSPMWDIYALLPRSRAFQQAEIERIKAAKPGFVLVLDVPIDGRDDLRFKNTHPLINEYIASNFQRVSGAPSQIFQIYAERAGAVK